MDDRQAIFSIPKIKCDGCAMSIKEAVSSLVESVEVDVPAKTVHVTLFPEGADSEQVRETLARAGYPPQ